MVACWRFCEPRLEADGRGGPGGGEALEEGKGWDPEVCPGAAEGVRRGGAAVGGRGGAPFGARGGGADEGACAVPLGAPEAGALVEWTGKGRLLVGWGTGGTLVVGLGALVGIDAPLYDRCGVGARVVGNGWEFGFRGVGGLGCERMKCEIGVPGIDSSTTTPGSRRVSACGAPECSAGVV